MAGKLVPAASMCLALGADSGPLPEARSGALQTSERSSVSPSQTRPSQEHLNEVSSLPAFTITLFARN